MKELNFFSHEKRSERLYLLTEGYSMVHRFTIGVIVGDEKILVIDSGMAMGGSNLRHYVETLVGTDKPIICACTHCHPDHVGGARQFDAAYCSYLDCQNPGALAYTYNKEQRFTDLSAFALENEEVCSYAKEHADINIRCDFLDIKDGDVLELGGVTIEVIGLPGHSAGSLAYFNRAEHYAFSGDSINTDVHLEILDRQQLCVYASALRRFISITGDDVTLYPTHLPLEMNIQIVRELVAACEDILSGNVAGDPPAEKIFPERQNNADLRIHYVHNTGIAYSAKKLQIPVFGTLHFYGYERISERLYIITENYSWVHRFTIGVLVGDDAVAVIDSGLGMDADLRTYIEQLVGTDKPMICLCTHGAIDHAGAACLFDKAYLNPRDYPMLESAFDTKRRLRDLSAFALNNQEVIDFAKSHVLDNTNSVFEAVDEGTFFDLGGLTIEPIRTPGHTMGHLAYYCRTENMIFAGDTVNADVHIKRLQTDGLRQCAQWLQRLISIVNKDTVFYAGHLNRGQRIRTAQNIADACLEVANGCTAGDPPGEAIFTDQNKKTSMRLHYVGNSCIVYNNDCPCVPTFPPLTPYSTEPKQIISFKRNAGESQ